MNSLIKIKKQVYNLTLTEVLEEFKTSLQGLSEQEVQKRLEKYGLNELPEAQRESVLAIYFRQYKSSLIYILLLAAGVVFSLGEIADGLVILFVIFFNSVVGALQEGRAQNTLFALRKMSPSEASVLREGKEIIIPSQELVPGDVIIIREGDKIPADARIIQSNSLKIDEAIITGESYYKNKTAESLELENKLPADQNNMVFRGTYVVSGHGQAVVTGTGLETYIGQISQKAALIEAEMPLKKEITALSKKIIYVVLFICVVLVILGILRGIRLDEIFKVAVAVAVSIIPEGLPIVVTLVLAMGVWRMSQKKVLVKKLQAVEALGQAKIVAVDKTGTLTKNELLVEKIWSCGSYYDVSGSGYNPEGKIFLNKEVINPEKSENIMLIAKTSAFCSNAQLAFLEKNQEWKISGDPIEAAMLVLAQKAGIQREIIKRKYPPIFEIPFDYLNKYHLVLNKDKERNIISVAGAPENIIRLSKKILTKNGSENLTEAGIKELEGIFFEMSAKGFRVIALAHGETKKDLLESRDIPEITFIGFLGMRDPLRNEVREAVARVESAGMKVVIITGDHKITAKTIALETGIKLTDENILLGTELEKMNFRELIHRLGSIRVFARVTPEHKMKIIEAYKKRGDIVAMTGDGVNDALSLAAADLGIAMGKIGTEVAKEASDLVILNDNFASIVDGVEEGRNILNTVKKVILYLFSTSAGEVLTIFTTFLLGWPLPILAAQILWLNLVTDGFLDMALAMEPKEKKLVERKKFSKKLIDKTSLSRIILMSGVMAIGTLFVFGMYYERDLTKAWTISLTTLAVFQWLNAWNCRSHSKSIFCWDFLSNKYLAGATMIVIILQLAAVYLPVMQKILHTVPINFKDWIIILAVSLSIIAAEEIRKFFYRRLGGLSAKNI